MNTLLFDFLRLPEMNSLLITITLVAAASGYFLGNYLQSKVDRGLISYQSMISILGVMMLFWASVSTMGKINHLF